MPRPDRLPAGRISGEPSAPRARVGSGRPDLHLQRILPPVVSWIAASSGSVGVGRCSVTGTPSVGVGRCSVTGTPSPAMSARAPFRSPLRGPQCANCLPHRLPRGRGERQGGVMTSRLRPRRPCGCGAPAETIERLHADSLLWCRDYLMHRSAEEAHPSEAVSGVAGFRPRLWWRGLLA
jgi:hypothetical protein